MITLYTAPTPNGHKISIALEELQLPYQLVVLNLGENDQKKPDFLKLNPNGKIPVIVDGDNDNTVVFESGAILLYLAEKTQKLIPSDPKKRLDVIQWLMFQMGGIGPMMGQANVWHRYMESLYQPAVDRYQHEVKRLFRVLDSRLSHRDYLVDELSIADIAHWAWVRTHEWSGVGIADLPNLNAWVERLGQRPAFQRGINAPAALIDTSDDKEQFIKSARDMLVK